MKTNYLNQSMIDIVFENRNKEFGAYVLRRDYNKSVSRAMLITVSSVFLLCFGNFVREHLKTNRPTIDRGIVCNPAGPPEVVAKPQVKPATTKHIEPPAPKPTSKDPEMKVVAQAQAPDTVAHNQDIKFDPGLINSNPINATAMGAENGKGKGTAEEVKPDKGEVTTPWIRYAEIMPEYPGGEKALMKFLASNTEYPEIERTEGIGGKVVTEFTVNEDGRVSDIAILKSPGARFDKEVMRVIKILHPFKPGMQQGKPVKVRYVLPFSFSAKE